MDLWIDVEVDGKKLKIYFYESASAFFACAYK